MSDEIYAINSVAWIIGNLLVAYIAIGVVAFVVGYFILFDPGATAAGRLIFRFFVSLVGIIGLIFIGTYIDPAGDRDWNALPYDVEVWRPILRVFIYGYVSFSITTLAMLLAMRKWWPHRILKAGDRNLVKVRHTHETNTTTEND